MMRRLINLLLGLMLFGLGIALIIKANLGADPWTVLHVGVARFCGFRTGTVVQLTGAGFMLASWGILRQPMGFGSISNMVLVGPFVDIFLTVIPSPIWLWLSIFQLFTAIVVLGLATALYISANMGAGPRDSFVIGVASLSGLSIKYVRLGFEAVALTCGYFLSGPVGFGTVIFALTIGPVMQYFLERFQSQKNPS